MTINPYLVRQAVALSVAASRDLDACKDRYQAALIRGDSDGAEKIRAEAHAFLDAMLDHHATAAGLSRAILGL